jgi:hypothetical protein
VDNSFGRRQKLCNARLLPSAFLLKWSAREAGRTIEFSAGFAAPSVENNVDYFYTLSENTQYFSLVKTYLFLVVTITSYLSIKIKSMDGPLARLTGICALPRVDPRYPQMRFNIS